jgi:hypothetical protein
MKIQIQRFIVFIFKNKINFISEVNVFSHYLEIWIIIFDIFLNGKLSFR